MAFQGVLDTLANTIHRDAITAPLVEHAAQSFRASLELFPWRLETSIVTQLNQLGIGVSQFGTLSHPHPIHKTIETYLLHEHWRALAARESSVLFMKPKKFEKLQRSNPNFRTLINVAQVSRDVTRYPESRRAWVETPLAFMHDALMYYSPAQIYDLFLNSPALINLYASLVVPPETYHSMQSLYPHVYQHAISGPTLHYTLEGNASGAYDQPLSASLWLSTHTIHGPQFSLSVTVLESYFSVHSILISRVLPSAVASVGLDREFSVPPSFLLPNPINSDLSVQSRLVPRDVYNALFTYVRAVRTLRVTDPAGYIRTQKSKPEYAWVHGAAWDHLAAFSLQTCSARPSLEFSFYRTPWRYFRDSLVRCYHSHYWRFGIAAALFRPIRELLPFRVNLFFHFQCLQRLGLYTPYSQLLSSVSGKLFTLATGKIWVKHPLFDGSIINFLLQPFHRSVQAQPYFSITFRLQTMPWAFRLHDLCNHPATWAIAFIALVPTLTKFALTGPTEQEYTDSYQDHFHPNPWRLTIPTRALRVTGEAFFLAHPEFEENSSGYSSQYPPPRKPSNDISLHSAPPAPLPDVRAPKLRSTPDLVDDVRPPGPLNPPPFPPPVSPPTPSPPPPNRPPKPHGTGKSSARPGLSPSAPNPPLLIPRPPPSIQKPKTAKSVRLQSQHPTELPPLMLLSVSRPTSPLSPEPELPKPISVSPQSPPAEEPLRPTSPPSPEPEPPKPNPRKPPCPADLRSPLEKDPSANGPVLPYAELHHLPAPDDEATFLSRRRNVGPIPPCPSQNVCLFEAMSEALAGFHTPEQLWDELARLLPDSQLTSELQERDGFDTDHITALAWEISLRVIVGSPWGVTRYGPLDGRCIFISYKPGHWYYDPSFVPSPEPQDRLKAERTPFASAALAFRDRSGYLLPFRTVHSYHFDSRRAKNLTTNLKNECDGRLAQFFRTNPGLDPSFFSRLDARADFPSRPSVEIIHLTGFAGCGKTAPVVELLKTRLFRSKFRVTLPTLELRNEWKQLLRHRSQDSWRVSTWETALLKSAPVLVIDEVYKMPNGYLDLCLVADPNIKFVILLGDPCQTSYNSLNSDSSNHRLESEIDHLSAYRDFYCFWSYRLPQSIARIFGVQSFNPAEGFVACRDHPDNALPVLTPSHNAARSMNDAGYRSITYNSSQGATHDRVT